MITDTLERLAATIKARRAETSDKSYTRQLLEAGPETCAKKFGEEAIETIQAAGREDGSALAREAADTLYHLLVLLESRGVEFADVMTVLEQRAGRSGLDEKASRGKGTP